MDELPEKAEQPIERCPCGYPMPCSKNVPITFCRAPIRAAASLQETK
jgi:hypothetical protein